jgi:hypothetical protein
MPPELRGCTKIDVTQAVLVLNVNGRTGTLKGKYHCTVELLFDWFGICCMTIDNFHFYSQNGLIQTGQTGGQLYIDTSPFSVPWVDFLQNVKRKNTLAYYG